MVGILQSNVVIKEIHMPLVFSMICDAKNVNRHFLEVVGWSWLLCFSPRRNQLGLLIVCTNDSCETVLKHPQFLELICWQMKLLKIVWNFAPLISALLGSLSIVLSWFLCILFVRPVFFFNLFLLSLQSVEFSFMQIYFQTVVSGSALFGCTTTFPSGTQVSQ